ncbi:hypothetical protein ABTE11_22135, partial [Acinetobacter baumannii]
GGAAGDDIFSGYRRHVALKYDQFFERTPRWLKKISQFIISLLPVSFPFIRRLKKVFKDIDKSQQQRLVGYFEWMDVSIVKKLFAKKNSS